MTNKKNFLILLIFLIIFYDYTLSVTVMESNGVVTIDNGHLLVSITLSNGTWTTKLDGTNIFQNMSGTIGGGSTTNGFSGWSATDINNGFGTGKEVTFNLKSGGTMKLDMYDNEYFFVAVLSKSGATGTVEIKGDFIIGTPRTTILLGNREWYWDLGRPITRVFGYPPTDPWQPNWNRSYFFISAADIGTLSNPLYDRPGILVGSIGIDARNQIAELNSISNGYSFSARCDANSSGSGQPFAFLTCPSQILTEQLEHYAKLIRISNNIQIAQTPCGFCTWDTYGNAVTQNDVYTVADQLVSTRLKEYGYTILQIDDGWQYGDRCVNQWYANSKFGGGSTDNDAMANVATQIRNRGLIPGLWLCPCSNCNASDQNYLNYISGLYNRITNTWGFDYIKLDFVYEIRNGTDLERRNVYTVMKNSSKPGTRIMHSNSFQWIAGGTIDALRCNDDVGISFDYTQGYSIRGAALSSMQWFFNRNLWINDYDMVHVRNSLTDGQARLWACLTGLSCGTIMASDKFWDTSQVNSSRLDLLKKIAPPYDSGGAGARPVDLFMHVSTVTTSTNADWPNIYVLPINKPWGKYYILNVINWNASANLNKTIDFEFCFGVPPTQQLLVYNFFSNILLGTYQGSMNVQVPPQDCLLYSVVPRQNYPQIISTTRHITQGGVDLQNVNWNAGTKQLTGTSTNLITNVPYSMVMFIPTGYEISSTNAGGSAMQVQNRSDGSTLLTFTPTNTTVNWTVNFGTSTVDVIPPNTITNLATSNPTDTTVTLTWTAPGDDGATGTAAEYDIRYSQNAISNDSLYNSAIQCTNEPNPLPAGTNQSFVVTGLTPGKTYYFAIKARDEVYNWSGLSNNPSATTSDKTPPSIISVTATGDPTTVKVVFSEPVEEISAETVTNYLIDNGISVLGAVLETDLITVTLTTSKLQSGITYTLTVNNIKDRAIPPNTIANNTQKTFNYIGGGDGLYAIYYSNEDFTGTQITRIDPEINFDWGYGTPDITLGEDNFSIRWTGQIRADYSEKYTFYTRTDDGVRLWIGNRLLIDAWVASGMDNERSATITLRAGSKYNLKMEYYEGTGAAGAQLRWSSPSVPKQIVPKTNLYSTISNTPTILISSTTLNFGEIPAGGTQVLTFDIFNAAGGTLTGSITTDQEWITVDPPSFVIPAQAGIQTINVTVDNSVLNQTEGEWTGKILIDSNGGTVTVDVIVTATCVLVKPNPYNPNKGLLTFFGDGIVPGETTIKIYTLSGELIKTLSAESNKEIVWDGKTENNKSATSGIYLYTYDSPKEKGIGKFTIIQK